MLTDISKEIYAQNSNEIIPIDKICGVISQKMLDGEIKIEQLMPFLSKDEQSVIKNGLKCHGAYKTEKESKLLYKKK